MNVRNNKPVPPYATPIRDVKNEGTEFKTDKIFCRQLDKGKSPSPYQRMVRVLSGQFK